MSEKRKVTVPDGSVGIDRPIWQGPVESGTRPWSRRPATDATDRPSASVPAARVLRGGAAELVQELLGGHGAGEHRVVVSDCVVVLGLGGGGDALGEDDDVIVTLVGAAHRALAAFASIETGTLTLKVVSSSAPVQADGFGIER